MKKLLASIVASVMVFSLAACGADEGVTQPDNQFSEEDTGNAADLATEPDNTVRGPGEGGDWVAYYESLTQADVLAMVEDVEAWGEVTVGSSTQLNADMFHGWTNNTPNSSLKQMIFNGYQVVSLIPTGEFIWNPVVVKNQSDQINPDGSKTFTIEIYDNLKWNDGQSVTAQDYLFYIMLRSSPEFMELDGAATIGIDFVGYESYSRGYLVNEENLAIDAEGNVIEEIVVDENGNEISVINGEVVPTKKFTGLNLIDDYKFSITINPDELPYFHEKVWFNDPIFVPMHVIAPGVIMTDDGTGCELSDNYTADLLRETMLDPVNGYRYNPRVTAGPYNFISYDEVANIAVVEANPDYLGNFDGSKPKIKTIIVKQTSQSTQINELEAGTVDLITGVSTGSRIEAGLDVVDAGLADYVSYFRNGYGFVRLHCDFGPTQFVAVRQAIALLLDRDEFARQYSGGYAMTVDSRYGLAQWEYQESREELAEMLDSYAFNPDRAVQLLIDDGWVLDENGGEYTSGIRYKMVDGELMPLIIRWASSQDNAVSDLLSIMLPSEAERIGMVIEQTVMDSVLDVQSRRGVAEPYYHMFNMGLTFAIPDRPWNAYRKDERFLIGTYNANYIVDDELDAIVMDMKGTDSDDKEAYRQKWLQFVRRWNELLPDIPLYSDDYYDFFNPAIKGYDSNPIWGFHYALQRAYLEN